MESFAEYVDRRDEASYNPLPYGSSGLLQTVAGVGASPIALASGLGQLKPRASGYAGFETARDFLLDLNAKNSEWSPYLLWVIGAAENYIKNQKPTEIAGVTMGKQAGLASKAASALGAVVKAAYVSLRNVVHTIGNIDVGLQDKVMPQVQAMLYGLDTIPKEQALGRLEEFKQRVTANKGSDFIDPDARMHQTWSKKLANVMTGH